MIAGGGWNDRTYAEPFAGGAGAAIALLLDGSVPRIAINDYDVAIYAFWKALASHPDLLIPQISDARLDLDEWHRQRSIYRAKNIEDLVELGYAAFYLNRTNRSGVLTGGVIGGLSQTGNDLIDARFNRLSLAERCESIAARASDIQVSNEDGAAFIAGLDLGKAFVYADPPYVEKGSSLYLNHFDAAQHAFLAGVLRDATDAAWLVTYDDVSTVRDLYSDCFQGTFELSYSAHTISTGRELMIASPSVAEVISQFEGLPTPK